MRTIGAKPASALSAYEPLVIVCAAACAGIVLDRAQPLGIGWWWLASWLAIGAWFLLWRTRQTRLAVLPLLVGVGLAAGAWHHARYCLFESDSIGLSAPETSGPVALEAIAVHGSRRVPAPPYDPLRTIPILDRTRIELLTLAVRQDATWQPAAGRLTLTVDGQLTGVRAGDRLRIYGQWVAVRQPSNPGEFNSAQSARARRHLAWLSTDLPNCVTTIEPGSPWSFGRLIDSLRTQGDALLWRNMGAHDARLGSAMFLGSRDELEPDQVQAFLETGTIHLLVISGLNVGILAGCLFLALRTALVPHRWSLAIVSLGCILYAITTDAQPPVVRATVMVLVSCAALTFGRRALAYNSIAAAGLVVLALNPAELFQYGTQLSFLSVVALVWVAKWRLQWITTDPLDRLVARTRPWPTRAAHRLLTIGFESVLVSSVIWAVVCPLVMSRFHLVSPVAVLLGPVLSIPVALAMTAGFGIFICGWIAPPLAVAWGWLGDMNLQIMESCVHAARGWRGSYFWVIGPSDWWLAGFYGALLVWVLAPRWCPPRRWLVGLAAGWSGLGLLVASMSPRVNGHLDCTFLAVGHGTAAVLELPDGKTLLYDAGRLGSPVYASRAVANHLWSRGIRHIDAVVISHADADHYNALPALLEQFTVGVIYVTPVMFERETESLKALRLAIERSGTPMREIWRGQQSLDQGDVAIDVLHPPRYGVIGSDNANSVVLAVEYQGRRILLAGDLEPPGIDQVVSEEPYPCDILLAPHHGSASSDPPGFAAWTTPGHTIVSGGDRDRLASVTNAYTTRGSRVLHTATSGAVMVGLAAGQVSVRCWREGAE